MNGFASSYVVPSIVTWSSCMHSRSAAWVFGEARLISSTSRRFANTGPGRNSNSLERWLKTLTPVTSDGSRSGVNWSRENEQSSDRASAFASIVFPTPGKSSMIRWPSLIRQRTHRRSVSSGAWTTRPRFSATRRMTSEACAFSVLGPSANQPLHPVEDRDRDLRLGRLLDAPLAVPRHEHDLVVRGVEADVRPRHVVVDDEVDAFVGEHAPLSR